jgi:hypothetical protein
MDIVLFDKYSIRGLVSSLERPGWCELALRPMPKEMHGAPPGPSPRLHFQKKRFPWLSAFEAKPLALHDA